MVWLVGQLRLETDSFRRLYTLDPMCFRNSAFQTMILWKCPGFVFVFEDHPLQKARAKRKQQKRWLTVDARNGHGAKNLTRPVPMDVISANRSRCLTPPTTAIRTTLRKLAAAGKGPDLHTIMHKFQGSVSTRLIPSNKKIDAAMKKGPDRQGGCPAARGLSGQTKWALLAAQRCGNDRLWLA